MLATNAHDLGVTIQITALPGFMFKLSKEDCICFAFAQTAVLYQVYIASLYLSAPPVYRRLGGNREISMAPACVILSLGLWSLIIVLLGLGLGLGLGRALGFGA